MKDEEKLDKWLRETLNDYVPEASTDSRNRFLSEAPSAKVKRSGKWYLYSSLALFIIISVIGMLLWFIGNESSIPLQTREFNTGINPSEQALADSAAITSSVPAKSNISTSGLPDHDPGKFKISAQPVVSGSLSREVHSNSGGQSGSGAPSPQPPDTLKHGEVEFDSESISGAVETNQPTISINDLNHVVKNKLDTVDLSTAEPVKTLAIPANNEKEKLYGSGNKFLLFYYRPEIIWNIIENEKLIHNYGIECRTNLFNGRYMLGTGLGISQSKGYFEYAVNYLEYMGSYSKLDSISFNWDPRNFQMEQVRHTTEELVFDSEVKTNYEKVYRNFVYFQVPLIMGYNFISREKVALGLRFTPILSVLMTKKAVDLKYDAGLNQVIQINRITPDRVKTNWQLSVGINYRRKLTRSLILEAEPAFSYYFNSVYEKPNDLQHPYGASIKFAIGIQY